MITVKDIDNALDSGDFDDVMQVYEQFVLEKMHQANVDNKDYGFLGLAGETGEVVDLWKKTYHGKELDISKLVEELGDVLFYITLVIAQNKLDLADILALNVIKLTKRYPEGADNGRRD